MISSSNGYTVGNFVYSIGEESARDGDVCEGWRVSLRVDNIRKQFIAKTVTWRERRDICFIYLLRVYECILCRGEIRARHERSIIIMIGKINLFSSALASVLISLLSRVFFFRTYARGVLRIYEQGNRLRRYRED